MYYTIENELVLLTEDFDKALRERRLILPLQHDKMSLFTDASSHLLLYVTAPGPQRGGGGGGPEEATAG